MALYHAEIIGKIGAMIGGLTYGAKAAEADKHIKTALKLTPDSPIAHIEHGNVLMLLHGDKQEDAAAAAYEKAAKAQAEATPWRRWTRPTRARSWNEPKGAATARLALVRARPLQSAARAFGRLAQR